MAVELSPSSTVPDTAPRHRFSEQRVIRRIELNELPAWSPWPARLLGVDNWLVAQRDASTIDREYDDEKYREALASYHAQPKPPSFGEFLQFRLQNQPAAEIVVSSGDELLVTTPASWCDEYAQLIASTMSADLERAATVIELGCGFGQNLWKLSQKFAGKRFIGGDYSSRAVELATYLGEDLPALSFCSFNYYDDGYDHIFNEVADGTAVVFTSHSVEQTPSAAHFVEVLSRHRQKIQAVHHFEPVYELHSESLLGMMRRRYAEVNNYNLDLMSVLETQPEIAISHRAADVMGLNPLNPTSVIRWSYCS